MISKKLTVAVISFFILITVFTACSDRSVNDVLMEEELIEQPDQIIRGFGITITDEGVKKTEVEALEAFIYEDKDQIVARHMNVKFFSSNGEYFSQLWADSGIVNMETNDMFAVGNVVVLTNDSLRLETETLNWDEEMEKISTEDSVVFYQEDKIIRGKGLYSDPGLEDVVILSPTGRFKTEGTDKDEERTDKR